MFDFVVVFEVYDVDFCHGKFEFFVVIGQL